MYRAKVWSELQVWSELPCLGPSYLGDGALFPFSGVLLQWAADRRLCKSAVGRKVNKASLQQFAYILKDKRAFINVDSTSVSSISPESFLAPQG